MGRRALGGDPKKTARGGNDEMRKAVALLVMLLCLVLAGAGAALAGQGEGAGYLYHVGWIRVHLTPDRELADRLYYDGLTLQVPLVAKGLGAGAGLYILLPDRLGGDAPLHGREDGLGPETLNVAYPGLSERASATVFIGGVAVGVSGYLVPLTTAWPDFEVALAR